MARRPGSGAARGAKASGSTDKSARKSTVNARAASADETPGEPATSAPKTRAAKNPTATRDIDPEALAELAEIGCTHEEAAAWLGMTAAALRRALRAPELKDAWARGWARGRVRIRRSQFALAERNASMASLLGRVFLGQGAEGGTALPGKLSFFIDTGIDRDPDPDTDQED